MMMDDDDDANDNGDDVHDDDDDVEELGKDGKDKWIPEPQMGEILSTISGYSAAQ